MLSIMAKPARQGFGPTPWGVATLAAAISMAGCDLPRDSRGTEEEVVGGEMRVGVVESPPWVVFKEGKVEGPEADLVRGLAERAHARVVWVRGRSEDLVEALLRAELALLVGGLTESDRAIEETGRSIPYMRSRLLVAVPPGQARPVSLRGLRVAARPASGVAKGLEDRGAVVAECDDPAGSGLTAALEDWEARARGLWPIDIDLGERERVLAVPPGENAWLGRVDRYLHERAPRFEEVLARGTSR